MNKFVLLLLGSLSLISTSQAEAGKLTTSGTHTIGGAPMPTEPIDPCAFVSSLPLPPFPCSHLPPRRITEAVEVSIGSIGGELDAAVISTVRQVVGHAVATGVVSTFVDTTNRGGSFPIEGGLSFCAETISDFIFIFDDSSLNKSDSDATLTSMPAPPFPTEPFLPIESAFDRFVNQLESIQPQSGTFYNIDRVDSCPLSQ